MNGISGSPMNRAKVATFNSTLSVVNMLLTYTLLFVYRTALVKIMGAQYVGITGLFGNVLQLFSLAELGISWAITYYLYKPLAENKEEEVAAIMNLLKRFYRIIGCIILTIGLLLTPFIGQLIKSDYPIEHIHLIFLLFLANTVLSYLFFSYYQILIIADRKNYIMFIPQSVVPLLFTTFQIGAIYFFHDFLLAVVMISLSTFFVNLWICCRARKLYPYLRKYADLKLAENKKLEIMTYVKATMLYKVSSTLMTSSTGIIVSSFVGIVTLGIYSNYCLIVDTVRSLVLNMIHPITAVIGEMNATSDVAHKIDVYKRLNFLMNWICMSSSVCLFVLLNPFIEIWIGPDYLLGQYTVSLIVLYFYVEFIPSFSTKFRDACGLNSFGKFRPLITALLNVTLSLILVHPFGLNGILVSMILSRLTTISWFDPWLVYRKVFFRSSMEYFKLLVVNTILTFLIIAGVQRLFNCFWQQSVQTFIAGFLLCLIIPNLIYYLIYKRSPYMRYYLNFASRIKNK